MGATRTTEDIDRDLIAVQHKMVRAEQRLDYGEMAAQEAQLDRLLDERYKAWTAEHQQGA